MGACRQDGARYCSEAGARPASGVHGAAPPAAAGAFLIDAETRLNPAAAAAYLGAGGGPQGESMETPPADEPAVESPEDEPSSEPRGPSPEDRKNIARLPAADRVAALGGVVEVHSVPGQGTTVRGRVPMVEVNGMVAR